MSFCIHRRDTEFRDQIWWKSVAAKFPKCRVVYQTKITRTPRDSSQPPFWPEWADRAQNSLNVVTLWPVHVYQIRSRSAAFCRTYSGKNWFFGPKSQYNKGFQPTIVRPPLIRYKALRARDLWDDVTRTFHFLSPSGVMCARENL